MRLGASVCKGDFESITSLSGTSVESGSGAAAKLVRMAQEGRIARTVIHALELMNSDLGLQIKIQVCNPRTLSLTVHRYNAS